ncbi:MAG TPA: hypothetical protein DCS93_04905 [Microscillaceae bacterium]|nr:hypothetical protein [Microscillaceae bacterium]
MKIFHGIRWNREKKKLIVIFLVFLSLLTYGQQIPKEGIVIVGNGSTEMKKLNSNLLIFESDSADLLFSQISSSFFASKYKPFNTFIKKQPSLKKKSTYWAKITFKNLSKRSHWILYVGQGSHIELFSPDKFGAYQKKVNGSFVKGSKRDIKSAVIGSTYKFNLFLSSERETVVFIKLKGSFYSPRFSLELVAPNEFYAKNSEQKIVQSIFQGGLWIIIFYNLILFILVKDRTYLFYVLYTLSYSIYYIMYYDIYNEIPEVQIFASIISSQVSMLFYFQFMRSFVNAKQIIRKWDKVIRFWVLAKSTIVFLFILYKIIDFNTELLDSFVVLNFYVDGSLFLITIVLLVLSKDTLARYVVIGSFFLMIGSVLSTISFSKILEVNFNENYFSQAGIFLELVLFSVGLGYRERKNEQEKRLAQEENARILKEQNVTLERKVKERTLEITEKNEELMMQKEEILTQRDALQERGEELQFAYNQITDSVRYAQTIQTAILPFEKKIKRVFDDYFIIFYPKDIVSGDFYWFNTIEDSSSVKAVVSAIDCTGHGVPGAFMSMIGNTLLNETINEKRIFDPAEVLTRLHHKIRQDLRQAETNNSDGMDMALCVVEQMPDQQYKLTFSGAKRPLYYIHEGELEQLKADRFSIGGEVYEDERERVFTNKEIMLDKGDMFYLLTDGFGDTPGMDRKRFGSRNIKKMITDAKDLSMPAQKEAFEAALANHMGDQEARDDVTFLGFKL